MAEYLEVEGDLFDPVWGFQAIGHGVNCMAVMGAGIAKQVAQKYPGVLRVYKDQCLAGNLKLGGYHGVMVSEDPLFIVFNLASQHLPGPNAEYQALTSAVGGALVDCAAMEISTLGLCQIGSGIGGLNWDVTSSILKTLVENTGVGITVVKWQP